MKKNKTFLIALIMICIFSIWGCGNKESSGDQNKETQQENTVSIQEVTEEPELKLSELMPDPRESFFDTEFEMITDDTSYTVYLDNITEEEWNEYLSKCEESGFWTKETYRSNYSWYVESEDGQYELLLDRYGDENKYMTIIVNKKG